MDHHHHHHRRGPRVGLEFTVPLGGGRRPPPTQTTTTTVVYNQPQAPPPTVVINNPQFGTPAQVYNSEIQYTGVQPAQVYSPGQPMYVQQQPAVVIPGPSSQTVVVTSSPTPPRRPRVGVNLKFRI